jgi:hypothetical protein
MTLTLFDPPIVEGLSAMVRPLYRFSSVDALLGEHAA